MNTDTLARQARSSGMPAESGLLRDAFARYQPELLGTLYYMLGCREDAQDALQEAFLKCWRHRAKLDEIVDLKAWIFRVALNAGRDFRRSAWRKRRVQLSEAAELVGRDEGPGVHLDRQEKLDRVHGALMDLREEEKQVFLLRQNGDLKYEQIAEALEIPLGTVKTRMRLALSKLRAALQPEFPI